MRFLFMLLWSFFASKNFFRNILYHHLNDFLEKDIKNYSIFLNQTKIIDNNDNKNILVNEGYDERYSRNETKEFEDIERIKNIFIKFNLLKILQNNKVPNAHKMEVLEKYISENEHDDSELNDFGKHFFKDITSHDFFKYLNFDII